LLLRCCSESRAVGIVLLISSLNTFMRPHTQDNAPHFSSVCVVFIVSLSSFLFLSPTPGGPIRLLQGFCSDPHPGLSPARLGVHGVRGLVPRHRPQGLISYLRACLRGCHTGYLKDTALFFFCFFVKRTGFLKDRGPLISHCDRPVNRNRGQKDEESNKKPLSSEFCFLKFLCLPSLFSARIGMRYALHTLLDLGAGCRF
jgi:hypothetical protein